MISPIIKKISVEIICIQCKKPQLVELEYKEYLDYYLRNKHIQDAMPNKPPGIRELFISGVCSKCFDEIFKEEERFHFMPKIKH